MFGKNNTTNPYLFFMCGGDYVSGQEGGGKICCCNRAQLAVSILITEDYCVKTKEK